MDWNNLKDTVANLTLYDVKASVRKVQNGERDPALGHLRSALPRLNMEAGLADR